MKAARSANEIDDAGRLFLKPKDNMDNFARQLQRDLIVPATDPIQLTDDILRSSPDYIVVHAAIIGHRQGRLSAIGVVSDHGNVVAVMGKRKT